MMPLCGLQELILNENNEGNDALNLSVVSLSGCLREKGDCCGAEQRDGLRRVRLGNFPVLEDRFPPRPFWVGLSLFDHVFRGYDRATLVARSLCRCLPCAVAS